LAGAGRSAEMSTRDGILTKMASKSSRNSRRGLKLSELPVKQVPENVDKPQKQKRKKAPKDLPSTEPAPKRTRKTLNKKEKKDLSEYLTSVDDDVLLFAVRSKLLEQPFPHTTKDFIEVLFENEQLLRDILIHHRFWFVELFLECQKGVDSFLRFQLQWHRHCSAFLLNKSYSLAEIQLGKTAESSVANFRTQWMDFCEKHGISESEVTKVMIPISSAIYELLLERAEHFQRSQKPTGSAAGRALDTADGDDVYFRFGGAALCDMLHQCYEQIKCCQNAQRDTISQEITILQAINMKDKTKLPQYLRYRDRGFMYFPDVAFIPFLRSLDEIVKEVINANTLLNNDRIIEVNLVFSNQHCILCLFVGCAQQSKGRTKHP